MVFAARHSDEGGRFFRSVARYALHMLPPDADVSEQADLAWMTLGQVAALVGLRGVFTNEARTLVSMMLAYA